MRQRIGGCIGGAACVRHARSVGNVVRTFAGRPVDVASVKCSIRVELLYMLVPICRPDPICKLGVPVCKLGVFENAGKACVLETVP